MNSRLAIAPILLLLCVAPAEARTECPQSLVDALQRYSMIVVDYRTGGDGALKTWLSWDPAQVLTLTEGLDDSCDPVKPWTLERYKAAVMLATDAAEARLQAKDAAGAMQQFRIAALLLAKAGPPVLDFASRWYELAARRLRSDVLLWQARELLASGRALMPDDPRVIYQSGITAEFSFVVNTNALEYFAREPRPMAGPPREARRRLEDGTKKAVREQGDRAEGWLAQVARGGSDAASLHLARLLLARGRPLNALAAADPVLERTADNRTAYLAALLGGAAREASGDLIGAAERYTRAIARYPDGEFGYVALSHALMRQGRYDDARSALGPVLSRPHLDDRVRDPWWLFGSEIGWPMDDAFAELREEARR